MPYATYRFNKIIAAETIRFIVTVAIVVYKGLKLVVYRMLTFLVSHVFLHTLSGVSLQFPVFVRVDEIGIQLRMGTTDGLG